MRSSSDFPIQDTVGAWVPHGRFVVAGNPDGPLKGLRFAVKDLFDVSGHPTGAGNPTWLQTHDIPSNSSPLIETLLAQGATLMGKVMTDELAYSINGDNAHYGTPLNTVSPRRVTGGSSSGSAAAVAARLVDFALGSDTGGSTRVPASYCGLWGLRTTHGALSTQGMVPLHPGYDTATWLAHDAQTFELVGDALLPPAEETQWKAILAPWDAWALSDGIFHPWLEAATRALQSLLSLDSPSRLAIGAGDLDHWRQAYVTTGAYEGWQVHGQWIERHAPMFSPAIARRWDTARRVTEREARAAAAQVADVRRKVGDLMRKDGIMILPSAAGLAPLRNASAIDVDDLRMRTMRITCIAGLCGLPQVSMPFHGRDPESGESVALGISLVGPAGSDRALIRLARQVKQTVDDACASAVHGCTSNAQHRP